jgi:hypothetical protein
MDKRSKETKKLFKNKTDDTRKQLMSRDSSSSSSSSSGSSFSSRLGFHPSIGTEDVGLEDVDKTNKLHN